MDFSFATIAVLLALLFGQPVVWYVGNTAKRREERRRTEIWAAEMNTRIAAQAQVTLDNWDRDYKEICRRFDSQRDVQKGV